MISFQIRLQADGFKTICQELRSYKIKKSIPKFTLQQEFTKLHFHSSTYCFDDDDNDDDDDAVMFYFFIQAGPLRDFTVNYKKNNKGPVCLE